MTGKRIVGSIAWAAGVALFASLFRGESLVISLELWLALGSMWLAGVLVIELLKTDPMETPGFLGVWRRRLHTAPRIDAIPADLRVLEGVVLRARDNRRAYETHLHPRLVALAEHHLPLSHGVDPRTQPAKAAALLGDVAWLLEPSAHDRTPSSSEVLRFVSAVSNVKEPTIPEPHDS